MLCRGLAEHREKRNGALPHCNVGTDKAASVTCREMCAAALCNW